MNDGFRHGGPSEWRTGTLIWRIQDFYGAMHGGCTPSQKIFKFIVLKWRTLVIYP